MQKSLPVPAPQPSTCTIGFVGDLMLGRQFNRAYRRFKPNSFWSDIGAAMRSCDSVFANLECPITTWTQPGSHCWKTFRFRAREEAIDVLRAGNVGYVSLANNHTLDFGDEGLEETICRLSAAGIAHSGAGSNLADARRAALVTVASTRIGIISFTDNVPEFAATDTRPGTNFLSLRSEMTSLDAIGTEIRRLRKNGAHIVVVSAHWGPNLRHRPSDRFQRFARCVIDLGADVFHGHSAHLVQGVERRRDGVILYDTGNFLDDYWVFPGFRIDRSALFVASFNNRRLASLRIVPASLRRMRVGLAPPREFAVIRRHLWRQSLSFGTRLTPISDGLALNFGSLVMTGGMARHNQRLLAAGVSA